MRDGRTRRVFVEMVREEWRLHARLFRGSHFALFPLLIAVLAAGTAGLLAVTGTGAATVFAGLHALAFVFGLHAGSIGFVGRDALDDLLGDVTLLVFSARTLPLSRSRLLGVFVVKDVVYYAVLFLLPMALGTVAAVCGVRSFAETVPAAGTVPLLAAAGTVPFPSAAGTVPLLAATGTVLLLWATLTLTFALGVGTTIAGLGLSRRGVPGLALLAGFVAAVGAAWVGGVDVAAYTPYGAFLAPTAPRIGATATLVLAVFLVGAVAFDATARRPARTVAPSFRRWWRRIGDPVATRTLLDVHRSSGGFGKVVFSAAVLAGVTAGLVDLAGRITGASPSVGISFGTVLGLTGFTTYNWLTQSDDLDSYLVHPLTVRDVFAAKFRAFVLLGPLVGLGFYVLALAWRGGRVSEAVVGAVLLVGVACYVFGTTAYLAGLSPNEFLFDAGLFAAFGAAVVVPLVPILVVGFALAPVPAGPLSALGLAGVGLGIAGVVLYRRSLPKWSTRYRQG